MIVADGEGNRVTRGGSHEPRLARVRAFLGVDSTLVGRAKQLNRNTAHLLAGNAFALGLNLITAAYLARVLGKTGFGTLSFAMSVGAYAALIVDLGLTTYGTRAIARAPAVSGELVPDIVLARIAMAAVTLAVASPLLVWIPAGPAEHLKMVILLCLLWVVPFAVAPEWFFLGTQRMAVVSLGKLLLFATILAATVLTVHGPGDVAAAASARTIGGIAWALWLVWKLPRGVHMLSGSRMRRAEGRVREARWFWLLAMVAQVYVGVDVLMLGACRPLDEVGVYSAGFRLVAFFLLAITLVNTGMFPILAAESEKGGAGFNAALRLYGFVAALMVIPVLILGVGLAPLVVKLAYGSGFGATVPLLRILTLGGAVLTINGALAQPLLAAGCEHVVTRQSVATAIIYVTLNAVVIPRFGASGAAWVFVASVTIGTVWLVPAYRRLVRSSRPRLVGADA